VSDDWHPHGEKAAGIGRLIAQAEKRLAQLEREREQMLKRLTAFREQQETAPSVAVVT